MGATPRRARHRSRRSTGSCAVSTARVLAAALERRSSSTSCSPASTPPTASAARSRRRSRRISACRTCRMPRGSSPTRRPGPSASGGSARPATTCSRRRCRRSSAAPRRSASRATRRSRGSWRPAPRRSRRARWPTSASIRRRSAAPSATTTVLGHASSRRPARATEVVRGTGRRGAARDRRLPRRAEDHLMAGLWVVGEPGPDGGARRRSAPRSRRSPASSAPSSGRDVVGIVVAADPARPARRSWRRTCRAS